VNARTLNGERGTLDCESPYAILLIIYIFFLIIIMTSKYDTIFKKVYYDPAGYGSMKTTLQDAKQLEPKIKYADVKDWFERNVIRKIQLKGQNSFIAQKPFPEFQIDLMFFIDLKDPVYSGGLLLVDIFTKYTTGIPIKTKQIHDVAEAIKQGLEKMGGKPETIYSDDEGALNSNEIQNYFKQENIRHLVTRGHAAVAERTIRTIKAMTYKRVEETKKPWHEVLFPVLLTYNNKLIHSSTNMTPNEAKKPKNQLEVKLNLELGSRHTRKYPTINVGDRVRLYRKKDKLDKERISVWSDTSYAVENITDSAGQKLYKLAGRPRPLMRHEILLVR